MFLYQDGNIKSTKYLKMRDNCIKINLISEKYFLIQYYNYYAKLNIIFPIWIWIQEDISMPLRSYKKTIFSKALYVYPYVHHTKKEIWQNLTRNQKDDNWSNEHDKTDKFCSVRKPNKFAIKENKCLC